MHSTGLIAVLLVAYLGNSYGCLSNPGQLPCDLNPCLNGATCTNVDVTSYTCSCADSYEGNNCETLKASPCSSSPCLNGGTCSVVADFYFCTCEAAKYAGYNCELTVSPCTSGPCQNGGTCNQVGDTFDYTCDCPVGYTDNACSTTLIFSTTPSDPVTVTTTTAPITVTTTAPVTMTTTAATVTTTPTVKTTPAVDPTTTPVVETTTPAETTTKPVFTTTSTPLPDCPNNQEYNFCASACPQTCRNPVIGFCIHICQQRCDCPHDFPILDEETGFCVTLETCPATTTQANEATTAEGSTSGEGSGDDEETTAEMPVTTVEETTVEMTTTTVEQTTAEMTTTTTTVPSTTVPTTTVPSTTVPTTTVPPTTTQVSICASNPCENGGVCNEILFGLTYTCTCPERYEGNNCETFVPACTSSPCQNGGICSDIDGGLTYQCACPVRYEGTDCETLILPCEPNPCQNGGTCTDNLDATYTCACNEGYLGDDCEIDITCSGNLAECLPIMSDISRNYADSKAYCEANGWHLAYIEDNAKYNLMINWVRTFWETEFAGFDIDTRNHWLGMEYLGSRIAANLGGDTTPYTIVNWYPLGYPTSLDSFPDNDRMVMLVSISDSNSFFQGLRNIDPFSTYYAVCQDPAYISTL